jgi:acetylornithine deacetylase/succinyl-diaminopimelate desuccinylase family protein
MADAGPLLRSVDDMAGEIVEVLQSLVRIPSPTGQEAEIGAFVAAQCRDMGLAVEVIEAAPGRPNVVATWDGAVPGPTLLLNDHLDMFPTGPADAWTHPPLAAEIAHGRVYGRGTIDTKSGLTTILMACKALRQSGLSLRGRLVLAFSCDEEVDSALGIQHLARMGRLEADMAIVTEPTTMQVEIATKGCLSVAITTRGKATHGARPWLGRNAIDDMAEVIAGLRGLAGRLGERSHPLLGSPSLNVGVIEGGTVSNMVPDHCRIEVDRRLLPDESREAARAEIQAVVDGVGAADPEFAASLEELRWRPGYLLDADEPVIEVVGAAFEKVVGRRPRVAVKDAGTDAPFIYTMAHVPVVMFSPGDGLEAGTVDESVAIDDLITATKVMAQVLFDVLVAGA